MSRETGQRAFSLFYDGAKFGGLVQISQGAITIPDKESIARIQ